MEEFHLFTCMMKKENTQDFHLLLVLGSALVSIVISMISRGLVYQYCIHKSDIRSFNFSMLISLTRQSSTSSPASSSIHSKLGPGI